MLIIASSLISAFTIDSAACSFFSAAQISASGNVQIDIKVQEKKKVQPFHAKMKHFGRKRAAAVKRLGSDGGVGWWGCCSGRREAGRHEPDAPLSMTEMEVKYALYEGNTGRDIKRWTTGERGGIMTLTSSKGCWSWRRRVHSRPIHSRDGSPHLDHLQL